jgi:hypothetical protein
VRLPRARLAFFQRSVHFKLHNNMINLRIKNRKQKPFLASLGASQKKP